MQPLSDDELHRIVRAPMGRGPTRHRNRALVELVATSGLGVAETLALRPADVDITANVIRVPGRRARLAELPESAGRSLGEWLANRGPRDDEAPLFCTSAGAPLEPSYVRRLLGDVGRRADVAGGLNARRLRAAFAARRLATGASLEDLRRELGHTNPTSTRRLVRNLAANGAGPGPGAEPEAPPQDGLAEALLEQAHCGLVILRAVRRADTIADFVMEYVNPAAAGAMGALPEALVGRSVAERFPEAATNGTFEHWSSLIANQGRTGDPRVRETGRGGSRWYAVRRMARGDRLLLSFNDQTAQRQAERLQARTEARADTVAATVGEGIVIIDADGGIAMANLAAQTVLGLSSERLVGRTAHDPRWRALNEDGSPCPGDDHPSAITRRTGQEIRGRVMGVRDRHGRIAWMRVSSRAIEEEGGPPFAVVVAFTDLTEVAEARGRSRRAEASAALLAMMCGGVLLRCAPDGRILDASGDTEMLFGLPPDGLPGRRCEDGVAAADRPAVQAAYLAAMEDEDARSVTHGVIHASGAVVMVERTLRAVRDPATGDVEEVQSFLRPASGGRP